MTYSFLSTLVILEWKFIRWQQKAAVSRCYNILKLKSGGGRLKLRAGMMSGRLLLHRASLLYQFVSFISASTNAAHKTVLSCFQTVCILFNSLQRRMCVREMSPLRQTFRYQPTDSFLLRGILPKLQAGCSCAFLILYPKPLARTVAIC